mmetsp:Transcript_6825/g.12666  ORF Transcript_6825/g.12666 Transcript_6825/m.12666 type:complete len:213 (-) Transcript_6825:247-885(-)
MFGGGGVGVGVDCCGGGLFTPRVRIRQDGSRCCRQRTSVCAITTATGCGDGNPTAVLPLHFGKDLRFKVLRHGALAVGSVCFAIIFGPRDVVQPPQRLDYGYCGFVVVFKSRHHSAETGTGTSRRRWQCLHRRPITPPFAVILREGAEGGFLSTDLLRAAQRLRCGPLVLRFKERDLTRQQSRLGFCRRLRRVGRCLVRLSLLHFQTHEVQV